MRRPSKRVLWILGAALGLPLVLVAIVVALANLDAGQRLIERLTGRLSDGKVVVTGLSGHFPGEIHIARLELRDSVGVWLTATDIAVDSSATALVFRHVKIAHLSAANVLVARSDATFSLKIWLMGRPRGGRAAHAGTRAAVSPREPTVGVE